MRLFNQHQVNIHHFVDYVYATGRWLNMPIKYSFADAATRHLKHIFKSLAIAETAICYLSTSENTNNNSNNKNR